VAVKVFEGEDVEKTAEPPEAPAWLLMVTVKVPPETGTSIAKA